jgi:hypothetical protein
MPLYLASNFGVKHVRAREKGYSVALGRQEASERALTGASSHPESAKSNTHPWKSCSH